MRGMGVRSWEFLSFSRARATREDLLVSAECEESVPVVLFQEGQVSRFCGKAGCLDEAAKPWRRTSPSPTHDG